MGKRLALLVLTSLALLFLASGNALAFRCGTRLVELGESRGQVILKCGPPDWIDWWVENRRDRVFGPPYSNWNRPWETRIPHDSIFQVTIEEWTYNLGPTQFIRILTFENSRLIRIDTGEYGY